MNEISLTLSESMETYLVTIARLRVDRQPVPLSQLAEMLSISPVSVNEMCRKLQDRGLAVYQPYKGVSLTPEGEQRAYYILRRHRLWEVFLVGNLGFDYDEAHEAACQLEHSTPNQVADRLDAFLEYPTVNPEGEPIPRADGVLPEHALLPLTALSAGQRSHIIRCEVDDAGNTFLGEHGIRPGAMLTVLALADDSLLVQVGEVQISLARTLAKMIKVESENANNETTSSTPLQSTLKELEMESKNETAINQIPLHKLNVGQLGVIVRLQGEGPVKQRMMAMGLVPGAEVKVLRVAPLGDPVEFKVKGYSLSLRKSEARNITVEIPAEEAE
jgi:DtxR family Mn-dependent transcriptional regulator